MCVCVCVCVYVYIYICVCVCKIHIPMISWLYYDFAATGRWLQEVAGTCRSVKTNLVH